MAFRSLSGNSGGSFNNVLFKPLNLADLNDVAVARYNLGLVGSLSVGTSPFLTLSSSFNGTANSTISLLASSTPSPNSLVVYDANTAISASYVGIGTVAVNALDVIGITTISGNLGLGTFPTKKLQVVGDTVISGNIGIGTASPLSKVHVIGTSYFNGNVGVGIQVPTKKLHVVGDSYFNGNVGIATASTTYKLQAQGDVMITGSTIVGGVIYCNSVNTIENLATQTDYTYSINHNNNHLTGVGNINMSGSLNLNNNNIQNVANVSKQLWSYNTTTGNTGASLAIPTASLNTWTLTTTSITNYTYRLTIPFTFNNEKTLKFNFTTKFSTTGTNSYIYLGLFTTSGSILGFVQSNYGSYVVNTSVIDSCVISLASYPLLVVGTTYTVAIFDKSVNSASIYTLTAPEISLFY